MAIFENLSKIDTVIDQKSIYRSIDIDFRKKIDIDTIRRQGRRSATVTVAVTVHRAAKKGVTVQRREAPLHGEKIRHRAAAQSAALL